MNIVTILVSLLDIVCDITGLLGDEVIIIACLLVAILVNIFLILLDKRGITGKLLLKLFFTAALSVIREIVAFLLTFFVLIGSLLILFRNTRRKILRGYLKNFLR